MLRCGGEKLAKTIIDSEIVKLEFLIIENDFYYKQGYVDRYLVDFNEKKVFSSRWKEKEKCFSEDVECEAYEYVERAQELIYRGI